MLLHVYVLNNYVNNVTYGEQIRWVLNEAVGHLGNVKKSVVVNADVNEAAEVDYVTDSSLYLHSGLKVCNLKNVSRKNGCRCVVTDISAGLFT